MSRTSKLQWTLLILMSFSAPASVFARFPLPDPELWGGGVQNTNGEMAVPVVAYNPNTGIVFLDSLGINGVRESDSGNLVEGDDVGMISISLANNEDYQLRELDGFVSFPDDFGGLVYTTSFNPKPDLFGVSAGAEFTQPGVWEIFQLPVGLTVSQLGVVEMAVNFEVGAPGALIFGQVQIVPEPASLCGLVMGCLAFAIVCRKKSAVSTKTA